MDCLSSTMNQRGVKQLICLTLLILLPLCLKTNFWSQVVIGNESRGLAGCGLTFKTLLRVSQKMGFEYIGHRYRRADVIWSYHCSWETLSPIIKRMNSQQRINKIPGIHRTTKKGLLSSQHFSFSPPTFRLPAEAEVLRGYIRDHPEAKFVTKGENHGKIAPFRHNFNITSVIQCVIRNPLLIDGHKFDLTIHILITSIDPFRVYYFADEITMRFAPFPYQNYVDDPANKSNSLSFMINDFFLAGALARPTLARLLRAGYSHKEALAVHLESLGMDPRAIYKRMPEIIIETLTANLVDIRNDIQSEFPHLDAGQNFFQMMRWDFLLDAKGQIYLLEANGSPNMEGYDNQRGKRMSRLFYEAFGILGLDSHVEDMEVEALNEHDLSTKVEHCSGCSRSHCLDLECLGCLQCLKETDRSMLLETVMEHRSSKSYKRLIPRPNWGDIALNASIWSPKDRVLQAWIQRKCHGDRFWC